MKINEEGYKIIATTGVGASIILGAMITLSYVGFVWWWATVIVGISLLVMVMLVAMFFRQPKRPMNFEPGTVFSPADGKIVVVEEIYENEYLKQKCIQVSVFMSVWNVHCNLYPVSGRVVYFRYHPGKFLVAWHPKSSEDNERTTVVLESGKHKLLLRQIAGKVARRIVTYAVVGEDVVQNHKLGFIKFGSRVDIMLPLDTHIMVKIGDKVTGGQTRIAKLS